MLGKKQNQISLGLGLQKQKQKDAKSVRDARVEDGRSFVRLGAVALVVSALVSVIGLSGGDLGWGLGPI